MTLPRLLVLTDRRQAPRPLVQVIEACVQVGVRAVVLREKDLLPADRAALAARLRAVLAPVGGILLLAADPSLSAGAPDADGVHLPAAAPLPRDRPGWVGRSCHDRAELAAAAAQGCTYATLSPIFASRSKPGYGPPLGPGACDGAPLPTFALGGIESPARAAACIRAGAHGVAVMGAVMRAADPGAVAAALGEAIAAAVDERLPHDTRQDAP